MTCSYCGERTTRINNAEPTVDREEARNVKLHELFDRYYERVCERRGIDADGPIPDDVPALRESGETFDFDRA